MRGSTRPQANPACPTRPYLLVDSLTVATTSDPIRARICVDRMAVSLLGMIQWVRLLGRIAEDHVPIAHRLVHALVSSPDDRSMARAELNLTAYIVNLARGSYLDPDITEKTDKPSFYAESFVREEYQKISDDLGAIFKERAP